MYMTTSKKGSRFSTGTKVPRDEETPYKAGELATTTSSQVSQHEPKTSFWILAELTLTYSPLWRSHTHCDEWDRRSKWIVTQDPTRLHSSRFRFVNPAKVRATPFLSSTEINNSSNAIESRLLVEPAIDHAIIDPHRRSPTLKETRQRDTGTDAPAPSACETDCGSPTLCRRNALSLWRKSDECQDVGGRRLPVLRNRTMPQL